MSFHSQSVCYWLLLYHISMFMVPSFRVLWKQYKEDQNALKPVHVALIVAAVPVNADFIAFPLTFESGYCYPDMYERS